MHSSLPGEPAQERRWRGPCTSVGGSALATWARSEEELRSSSVRGQILFTVGLPSVYELFTCFFPGGDEGWGCRWVRGQRPPRRAYRFPSEEKPQGCRSVSSPERIQPLLLPPAEAPCPNLTRLCAPPFWWAPLGFSQASVPSGTYPANLCRRHRSASAPPLMRCPRKRHLKIIAVVDDDVETRAALRVVQPCAPQPRGNPVLLLTFIYFAFAPLTVSSVCYHCSECNMHGWTNDVSLTKKGTIG